MLAHRRNDVMVVLATTALLLAGCGGGEGRAPSHSRSTGPDVVTGCPAGTDPDRPGPAGQAKPHALGGAMSAAVDADSSKLVALVAKPGGGQGGHSETWTLDLCTNTWHQQHPPRSPSGMAETRLVYASDADVVFAWSPRERKGWVYDLGRDEWTRVARAPRRPLEDPVHHADGPGSVILRDAGNGALWTYDALSDTWSRFAGPSLTGDHETDVGDFHSFMVADPKRDQLILVQNAFIPETARTWLFDLHLGRWYRLPGTTPEVSTGYFEMGGEAVFDQYADTLLLLGVAQLEAFSPASNTWREVALPATLVSGAPTYQPMGPLARLGHTLVYDPLNARVLVLGGLSRRGTDPDWARADDVWAYDTTSDTWTELVAP